jgi:putative heme-binding domain-containing protein
MTVAQATKLSGDAAQPLADRQQALWQLCRLNNSESHASLVSALKSPEPTLRQIAAHSISVQRVAGVAQALEQALAAEKEPQVQRALAEALGRLGTADSMSVLLQALVGVEDDRMLEHSLLYAMIELDQPERLVASLKASDPGARRAAMIVIDQSARSDLMNPSDVLAGLTSKQPALRQCAVDILVRHPEWASHHAKEFSEGWTRALGDADLRRSFADLLATWSAAPEIAESIGKQLTSAAALPASEQRALLETLSGIQNQTLPSAWSASLLALLKQSDVETRAALVAWLAAMKIDAADAVGIRDSLLALVEQSQDVPAKLRLLGALPAGSTLSDGQLESLVIEGFLGQHGATGADEAAKALGRIQLSRAASQQLISALDRVPPLQLMQAITSISSLKQDELDSQLLEQLVKLPAARTLPLDQLTSLYRNRSQSLRATARGVVESLGKPPADVEAKLDALLARLKSGDAARGFQVFRSTKAACSACHRIGYVGGQIGPELSHIGPTRTRRALLEAIVFPNARLEQSYTPLRVLTADGQVFNGLVARESADSLELITGANQRVTIPIADIEQRLPSPVSIMPAGLEQQLTLDELADLLTLLEATK